MGWWSCTVMGGDQPLDILNELTVIVGGKFSFDDRELGAAGGGDHCCIYAREGVEEYFSEALKYCLERNHDRDIALHVLGHMALRTGASLPEYARELIIEAANTDSTWDDGGDNGPVRKEFMLDFARKIAQHQRGTITLLPCGGSPK